MKRLNPLGKRSAGAGADDAEAGEKWYFARLAFLAIPWKCRNDKPLRGVLFKNYYLLEAEDLASAFLKAERILAICENTKGEGKLNGRRVLFKKIGILDLEPLYQELKSGVEFFDESETNISEAQIAHCVISPARKRRMIAYDKRHGSPPLLDVYWGEDFNQIHETTK